MSTLYVDNLQPNLGNAVHAAGHVVQVVDTKFTTQYSINTDGWNTIGTLSITPKFNNSKIVIVSNQHVYAGAGTSGYWHAVLMRLLRDGTSIYGDEGADPYGEGFWIDNSQERWMTYDQRNITDTPNTTSSVTYSVQYSRKDLRINEFVINAGAYGAQGYMSLMEIAQ